MEIGTVRRVEIDEEVKKAYLDYAMSVIVSRALPDVRDGLKPVHRRILYAMHDMGLRPNSPYKKSARIVGEVLGKYHPHGDAAVYDAMVRMAQDFSMRYLLVDGQGNFGSIDGDSPAAMRYTEARLAPIAEEMLQDIDKDTIDWVDNFDGTLKEPSILPAKLPNLLLNGASGIAVGMATNIPPHNLGELCDAISYLIDHYDKVERVTVDDLMRFIKGPDFPTGALILGVDGVKSAYATGKGRVVVRAVAHIEPMRGNRERILITELPYQVNKSGLIEKIAELVRDGRITDISDLRDESDRHGLSISIELKRGAQASTVLNQLFKYTPLQSTFGVNMLTLVDGEPRVLSLKKALQLYIEHRCQVITRRSRFELDRARQRGHILEGLLKALANLDEVIATIRRSPDADTARKRLMSKFKLTEIQAQAILDMQLRRLAALERKKIEEEYAQIKRTIGYLVDLLKHPRKILGLLKDDLADLKTKYGDRRRTNIVAEASEDISHEDLVPQEDVLISITRRGYVGRVPTRTYRPQARGGRGVTGMTTREEDAVQYIFAASTMDSILYFTNRGRVFQEKAHQIPDITRQAKGLPLANLIALESGELVTAAIAVPDFEAAEYLTMVTREGRVKRTALSEFASVRPSGLVAIVLEEGDELGWVRLTSGGQELIIVTERGKAIRFNEDEVRPMGRSASGVGAIKLDEGDHVVSMDVIRPGADLLLVTTGAYCKRVPLSEYPTQGRYGSGVLTVDVNKLEQTGIVAAARVVDEADEITIVSGEGVVLRTWVKHIPCLGRSTWGRLVRRRETIMKLREGDVVASVARLNSREEAAQAASREGEAGEVTDRKSGASTGRKKRASVPEAKRRVPVPEGQRRVPVPEGQRRVKEKAEPAAISPTKRSVPEGQRKVPVPEGQRRVKKKAEPAAISPTKRPVPEGQRKVPVPEGQRKVKAPRTTPRKK
jgi:DNA gyrase subunit A